MALRSMFKSGCRGDSEEIVQSVSNSVENVDIPKTTLIFYDLELSRVGQVEQTSAFTDPSYSFSAWIRITVRTKTSPNLRSASPKLYIALASELIHVMSRFVEWIRMQHFMDNGSLNLTLVRVATMCISSGS